MRVDFKEKITTRKPSWLKKRLPTGPTFEQIKTLIADSHLHTICEEARCPNRWECFSNRTATFMILGNRCTRNCRYCAVEHGPNGRPAKDEADRVAKAAKAMHIDYVVVTSVTRDDLNDGGASFFAETIREIKKSNPGTRVEVLIPDFQGNWDHLHTVLNAGPAVLNHNIETVRYLFPTIRSKADYDRSLNLLSESRRYAPEIPTKSGMMLGLGETDNDIEKTLYDLIEAGCSMVTLGQYLQPTKSHIPVDRFIHPDDFQKWEEKAQAIGFTGVASGPFVRSSYNAKKLYFEHRQDVSQPIPT
ncbi:lipoyl synthase [bacterium]|nr:lipoyl synthase [bacterium]